MLTAREPSVKPLADVVRCYICCDGQNESRNTRHLSHLPSRINGRARPQNKYIINFGKKIQETMRPAKASPFGRGVTEGDGEGKPGKIEPLCSDKQTFCQSEPSPRSKFFISVLALSGASRQLSQRESLCNTKSGAHRWSSLCVPHFVLFCTERRTRAPRAARRESGANHKPLSLFNR